MRHFTTRVSLGIAVVGICVVAKVLIDEHALLRYRTFVESHYRSQLSLIEMEMKIGEDLDHHSIRFMDSLMRAVARDEILRRALSPPEIFSASWSQDGRGTENLKEAPAGSSYTQACRLTQPSPWPARIRDWLPDWLPDWPAASKPTNGSRHALYRGQATDGTRLLVYEGWVNSPWKRDYWIVFTRSGIESSINRSESVQPAD